MNCPPTVQLLRVIFCLWSIAVLNRFVRWLFGYVEFAFSGGFADDFLNDCCKNNISIFKVECDDC